MKAHAVGARVRSVFPGEHQRAARNSALRRLGQIPHRVVSVLDADIERLGGDEPGRRLHGGDERARNVLHMHYRTPRCAVALYLDFAGGVGAGDQVVEYDVAAQVGGRTEHRGRPQRRHGEAVVAQAHQLALRLPLGLGIGGDGIFLAVVFLDLAAHIGNAIHTLRGGVYEALHTRLPGTTGERHGATEIDVFREAGGQLAERVVREPREVHHDIHAVEVLAHDVADILADLARNPGIGIQLVAYVVFGIVTDDAVPLVHKHFAQHRSDVAFVTCDQNIHARSVT